MGSAVKSTKAKINLRWNNIGNETFSTRSLRGKLQKGVALAKFFT